jgi:preprotein translocase subunit SecY
MTSFSSKIKLLTSDSALSKKILFVLGALVVFRLLANIPIPAAVGANLGSMLAQNQALGFVNLLTGGGLSALSIVMLGVGPYITASIIMQLLTMMSEKLKSMYHDEGEAGKKRFIQISRKLTIPLAFLQGVGLIFYLKSQGFIGDLSLLQFGTSLMVIVAGSMLLMWIGELITEFGIGNGVSLIIFAGIVAGLPSVVGQLYAQYVVADLPMYIGFLIAAVAIIAAIVTITEAERPVPITYAKQVRGQKTHGGVSTYLPLRVNQAGVIPIIFALSLLVFPQVLVNFMTLVDNETVQNISLAISNFLANTLATSIIYFVLVFAFTYFYTAVTFDPESIATNLQKNGAFIPGVRPGAATAEHIGKILTRITFVGALFLAIVAVLPFAMIAVTGNQSFAIGGTALLIVVSVVLDLVKRIEAQLSMREY